MAGRRRTEGVPGGPSGILDDQQSSNVSTRGAMKKYFEGHITSLKREKGFLYFEVEDQAIVRHATILGDAYSWATLEDNSLAEYLFTEEPSFDGPTSDE